MPIERNVLDDRLRELRIYSEYYHRLELKPLCHLLMPDEKLNCVLTGVYKESRKMLAVTDSRIMVISAGVAVQPTVVTIRRSAVKDWKFTKRFLTSSLEITTAEGKVFMKNTQKKRAALFEAAMKAPIREYDK